MDWRHRAVCLDEDPELFFPIGNTGPAIMQIEEAKQVCRRCDVREQCLAWALEAGQDHGVVPVGAGVYGTTGRLEKGYRLMGAELEAEYSPVEAGLARPKVKSADFIGKEAYLKARDSDPVATMCTFTVDDHTSARDGIARYMTGGEPILTSTGQRIVDSLGRPSYVTSAGAGPSLGKYLLMGYVPTEMATEGVSFLVRYMNEDYPITLARAGSRPLFDPDDERMKG